MTIHARLVALSLTALSFLSTTTVHAADCRDTPNVIRSAADLKSNTDAGGHVSIHVKGQKTEKGKSQFASQSAYQSVWSQWSQYKGAKGPKPKTCGGGSAGVMDCVPADLIGMNNPTDGHVCEDVDDKGVCTKGHDFTPVKVAFRYAKSDTGSNKGKWILNTAYPTTNDNCN